MKKSIGGKKSALRRCNKDFGENCTGEIPSRDNHATMPKQEEIEEAIKVVASQVTVQACPGFALHAALWWMAIKSKEAEE